MNEQGLLRVGGRIKHSNMPYNSKHPYILPKKHIFTNLIIWHYHVLNLHTAPQANLNQIRQTFWIISGKQSVSAFIRSCIACKRCQPKAITPIMGDLPNVRLAPSRPFTICGTDFAGPFSIRSLASRKAIHSKAYLCIFICFSTKAVHLEVVSNLTTDAFISCLKRFLSRRGYCKEIHSDNGSNFVGASAQIKNYHILFSDAHRNDAISDFLSKLSISWKFNPVSAVNEQSSQQNIIYIKQQKIIRSHFKN